MAEVLGAEVSEFMLLEVAPDVFRRIELLAVGGQAFELESACVRVDEAAHAPAAMRLQSIPDDEDFLADRCFGHFEELKRRILS